MNDERSILQGRVNELLNKRALSLPEMVNKVVGISGQISDDIVPSTCIKFEAHPDDNITVGDIDESEPWRHSTLHPHAVGQIAERFKIPQRYFKNLYFGNEWEKGLAAYVINEHLQNAPERRLLMRSVDGEVRGVLSDKYRRLNSMRIFLAFLEGAQNTGSKLVDGHNGDTRGYLEIIRPEIVGFDTPLNGKNFAVFGSRIQSSDYGDGALQLNTFMMNVRCMNGLVGNSLLREVHLGGRIPDNLILSNETVEKDTEARAALVSDVMKQIYDPSSIKNMIEKIQGASTNEIDFKEKIKTLPKMGVTEGELRKLENVLMSNDPSNGLFGSPTDWKFNNALTAVARDSEPARKRELEKLAGELIGI